ncbi:FecR domain-containing protein [Niveispirillum sp.]|uniref:FecR family protein n=1 Tax=Niveispirillum sp. TaxID=1917217 RepID=UPI001B43DDCC|nr:FecR domain-containing protein [Niveispirillum sp.]MBP7335930.1 FecR domain-containing protein [Niveispirillum sp.]
MERKRTIEAEAAEWLVRRSEGRQDPAADAAFQAWRDADPRHQGAYVRLQAVDARLARLRAASTGRMEPPAWRRAIARHPLTAAALAACLLMTVALGAALWPGPVDLETAVGEQRRSVLADGSSVELNTATHLAIDLSATLREIHLEQGEALFQVAKDKARPFVVRTPLADVRAVGTAFTVNIDGGDLAVAVSEGVVSIEQAGRELTRVAAGQNFRMTPDGHSQQEEHPVAELERLQSWRSGRLVFAGETLAAAAAAFNRYNHLHIDIPDPSIAALQVGGSFRATDPAGFTDALVQSFPVGVQRQGNRLILTRRQDQSGNKENVQGKNNLE